MDEKIRGIMSSVFQIKADEINDDSSQSSIESWDSLKHLQLVVALEEEFLIRLEDEESVAMLNYPIIYQIVEEKLKK